jgi:hypothetical protein
MTISQAQEHKRDFDALLSGSEDDYDKLAPPLIGQEAEN